MQTPHLPSEDAWEPPRLWALTVGGASQSDFDVVHHPAGFIGWRYKHGKWPGGACREARPGVLEPAHIRAWLSLYYVRCPLCHCVRPFSTAEIRGLVACPGWDGDVHCPGNYSRVFRPGATCSIQ
jgi:hypothetical protein